MIVLLASCGVARADMMTRDLLLACRQIETQGRVKGAKVSVPDRAASGICIGFFSALVGATLFRGADDRPLLGICTPDHASAYDLIRATEHFVVANPATVDQRAIVVVLSAAKQAFPCRRTTDSSVVR